MKSTASRLSVLIVTYNQEQYIREALESVLMQRTDVPFEIVIADDDSQDGTLGVLKDLAGDRINILPPSGHLGITRNYQRGFQACLGEYVAVLEGDDYWTSPTKLQTQIEFLDLNRECTLCFHRFFRHDTRSDELTVEPRFSDTDELMRLSARQLARGNFIGNFSTCMYRREIIGRIDPRLFELKVYDWMFNIVVATHGPIGYLPTPMSVYRLHANGAWSSHSVKEQNDQLTDAIDSYDKFLNFKFKTEFDSVRRAISHHRKAETAHSLIARLAARVTPFVPPLSMNVARKCYRLIRRKRLHQNGGNDKRIDLVDKGSEAAADGRFAGAGFPNALDGSASTASDRETVSFTAHNIRLDSGDYTKPEMGMDMQNYPWFVAAEKVLNLVFPDNKTLYSLVDLGCLEGGYAVEFARMGFRSLGIEARSGNFAACNYVKQRVNLPNLSFVQDDVWNVSYYGKFDVAFACGILYHLDRPRAFINLLSQVARRVIILQTHFASEAAVETYRLSDPAEWEGATGRWTVEFTEGTDRELIESSRWSSWGNSKSFWLTRPWILQTLYEAGFDFVFEQFDSLAPSIASAMTAGKYKTESRGTFVGVRTKAFARERDLLAVTREDE